MAYTLTKGNQSNYLLEITFTAEDQVHEKAHVLKHFQADMNLAGFRKGQVPLDLVEKNVQPEYLQMSIVEHIANHGIQDAVTQHPEIKFIGEPYDYSQDEKDGSTTIKLKLDIYPEIEIKKDSWKSETIKPISVKVEKKDVEDAITNLRKNYADYQDTEVLELGTVSKIALEWFDKDGESLEKGTTYIGEPEFAEDPFREKTFVGQKKGAEIELKYDEKLPEVLHAKPVAEHPAKPAKLKATIKDVKKQILPEFTEENILKFFGKESEVKNETELKAFIEKQLYAQKEQTALITAVEEFVSKIRKDAMSVSIPKTMIDEEFKSRVQSLEQRFGSKEKVEEYLKAMTEEQRKQFIEDIQKASSESLEKFFILNKVTELLGIEIDWNSQDLSVEKKIYEHFNPTVGEGIEKKPTEKKTKKPE
ncbi:trigger factor [Clostridia bacterium]|nr:trigger factor [Clostridia bacterium]